MSKAIFIFNGTQTMIQCNNNEKMKEICQKFATKAQLKFDKMFFIYGGNKVDYELTYERLANSIDFKNKSINVLAYELDNCSEKKLEDMGKKNNLTKENIRDIISEDLKIKGKELLIKHLDGRIYKEDKVNEWIENILNDCENYFKEKYSSYHLFMLCEVCSINTYFNGSSKGLLASQENYVFPVFKTDELFSRFHLFFFTNFTSIENSSLEPKILSYGNKLLYEIFDERKYDAKMDDYRSRFNNEFNTYFHNLDCKKRVYNITYAFQKPLKDFSYNYRTISPYNLIRIIQTFFTKDTEIYHYLFIFSNDKEKKIA